MRKAILVISRNDMFLLYNLSKLVLKVFKCYAARWNNKSRLFNLTYAAVIVAIASASGLLQSAQFHPARRKTPKETWQRVSLSGRGMGVV